jgi:hypothetical protein
MLLAFNRKAARLLPNVNSSLPDEVKTPMKRAC